MRFVLTAIAATALCASAETADPWPTLATHDLDAIHNLLLANHPGPVDTQNPAFKDWLEKGLSEARQRAAGATSPEDYQRALRYYTNGFHDGHIAVAFKNTAPEDEWPGLIVGTSAGAAVVTDAVPDAGVKPIAKLLSCDGQSVDTLLKSRTDPYYWNAAIPHQRIKWADLLFYQPSTDNQPLLKSCVFSSGTVELKWRKIVDGDFQKRLAHAQGRDRKLPSIRQTDGVWLISLPRFYFQTDAETAQMHAVIDAIKKNVGILRKATVIFDVRGNTGGNSAWGDDIVDAFWGAAWHDRANARVGGYTVDWRASPANLEMLRKDVETAKQAGLDTSETQPVIAELADAIANGKTFARETEKPPAISAEPPADPVSGRVFFLTDNYCGSACLDFADLMHQLPGVVQVGLPTNADSVYMDIARAPLPSGLAAFGWGMKVYRDRSRGNNVWYEPKYRWTGGPMNDDAAVVRWIKSLPKP